jgi:hypothetical protein
MVEMDDVCAWWRAAAVKLAAFKGTPGTKVVGMVWVESWVMIEILVLLARDLDSGPEGEGSLTLRQHGCVGGVRENASCSRHLT